MQYIWYTTKESQYYNYILDLDLKHYTNETTVDEKGKSNIITKLFSSQQQLFWKPTEVIL